MPDKALKTLLITVNIILVAVIAAMAVIISSLTKNAEPTAAEPEPVSSETESVQSNLPYSTPNDELSQESGAPDAANYIIKSYNGKIAVFIRGESRPIIESEIDVSGLTSEDARLLEQGISAENLSQLFDILEDYDY